MQTKKSGGCAAAAPSAFGAGTEALTLTSPTPALLDGERPLDVDARDAERWRAAGAGVVQPARRDLLDALDVDRCRLDGGGEDVHDVDAVADGCHDAAPLAGRGLDAGGQPLAVHTAGSGAWPLDMSSSPSLATSLAPAKSPFCKPSRAFSARSLTAAWPTAAAMAVACPVSGCTSQSATPA